MSATSPRPSASPTRSRATPSSTGCARSDEARLETLWAAADETRRRYVGDAVHLRGLVEVSNYCVRGCTYCGIRAGQPRRGALPRVRGRRAGLRPQAPWSSATAHW